MSNDPHGPSPSSRVAHTWLDSFKTGLKFRLALTGAAFLVVGLLAAGVMLLPRSWSHLRAPIFFSSFVLLIMIAAVIALVRGRRTLLGRSENRDLAFSWLAEKSARYARTGRRYHGILGRRRFDAYINDVKEAHQTVSSGVYAGDHIEMILDLDMKVRLKAGPYDPLLSKVGDYMKGDLTALKEEAPEGLIVYAFDADWGRRILGDEKAAGLLYELLKPQDEIEIRNISLWPGSAMLTIHRLNPANLTDQNTKDWLAKLAAWLERLETLAPPEQPAKASKWDNVLRGDRKSIFKAALITVIVILLLFTITVLGILYVLIRK